MQDQHHSKKRYSESYGKLMILRVMPVEVVRPYRILYQRTLRLSYFYSSGRSLFKEKLFINSPTMCSESEALPPFPQNKILPSFFSELTHISATFLIESNNFLSDNNFCFTSIDCFIDSFILIIITPFPAFPQKRKEYGFPNFLMFKFFLNIDKRFLSNLFLLLLILQ